MNALELKAVARFRRCSADTVRRAIARGELRAKKEYGRWFVAPKDAREWHPRPIGRPRKS